MGWRSFGREALLKVMMALAALSLAAAQPADPAPVIAAERAFAARAAVVGIAPSFMEYMTDEAIVFAPDPVKARAFYSARPAGKAPREGGPLLAWWPNFAGVARSGDLGFTTGPATIDGKGGLFYFTVWARQPDGGWKWIYDGGVEADGAAAPGPEITPVALPPGDARPLVPAVALAQVRMAEAALAGRARADAASAYKGVLAPDARVQGPKLPPATTPAAIDRGLATRARAIDFSPLGGGASEAGDLAWTYGDARWDKGRGHYVRIWQRRAGKWALVFDQIIEVEASRAG
jgi:ketosteroid isomerase-like protein